MSGSEEQRRAERDAIHHLEEAVEAEQTSETNFHIRQALQLLRVQ